MTSQTATYRSDEMSMKKFPKRAKQWIDFSSLSWGKIHPSDIDAVLEFGGKKLVLIELKTEDKQADRGQQLLLERLADNWKSNSGKDSLVIYASHHEMDTDEDVDLGMAEVTSVYWKGEYIELHNYRTVKSVVEGFAREEILERLSREECLQLKP